MPKLDEKTIKKHHLGTWDLIDFVFGMPTLALSSFDFFLRPRKRFFVHSIPLPLVFLYRVENILRLMEWSLFLKGHKTLSRFVNIFRCWMFRVCDWLSWKVL